MSRECCPVARGVPFSSGLGLGKWVMICLSSLLNKVAAARKCQVKVEPEGRRNIVLGADGVPSRNALCPSDT